MKSLVCLLILPEFKNNDHIERWNTNIEWARKAYINSDITDVDIEKRWAIGYLAWRKLLQHNTNPNIKVFFVRTDYRLEFGTHTIENDIISVGFNKNYGHIIYKTLSAINLLEC